MTMNSPDDMLPHAPKVEPSSGKNTPASWIVRGSSRLDTDSSSTSVLIHPFVAVDAAVACHIPIRLAWGWAYEGGRLGCVQGYRGEPVAGDERGGAEEQGETGKLELRLHLWMPVLDEHR